MTRSKNKQSVVIIGASGHGKVVADIIACIGDEIKGFLDDNSNLNGTFIGFPVLGKIDEFWKFSECRFIVAIGNAAIRERITQKLSQVQWYTAIHPTAAVSSMDTFIGEGTVVMANTTINAGAKVGKHCIINSSAVVEHDDIIEDYAHISVGVKLAGNVHVGKKTWIGIGAIVSNNVSICKDCMIGAGAVVIKNIREDGTYIGVPARRTEEKMYKICYVVTIPLTIESFFIPQLKYLSVNGFDVTVVCSNSSTLQKKLGERIHFNPIDIPRGISVGGSMRALKSLTQFFMKEKFDLIQYSTPNAAFYSSLAARIAGCSVRNYHLMGFRYLGATGSGRYLLKCFEKVACQNSTSIECVSKSNMEIGIAEKLFSQEKATVVWNGSTGGVDLSKFDFLKRLEWRAEIRKELGYDENDFIYGFVGRITRDKGINELLSAFLKLEDSSKLLLVGDVEKDNKLDENLLAKVQDDPRVCFHSFVSDIEKYYAAIDVLILPSYREGFGNVVIEAGAVGTPAIVSNIPGPIDAVEAGKTAFIVKAKDTNSLLKAMKKIQATDYKRMGIQAAQFARERFDSIMLCEKILERKKRLMAITLSKGESFIR